MRTKHKPAKSQTLTLVIEPSLKEQVQELATSMRVSVGWLVREAVISYLQQKSKDQAA